jgi:4-aminobutyrate aminotransferase-like enzyme
MIERKMMANAQAMGARLRERLEAVQAQSALLGDIRGKGLLMAIEIVVDKEAKTPPPAELQAVYRIIELGLERGIALYSRRTANGRYGEWLMVAPPLIVTAAEVDEIADLIGATLQAYEEELRRKRVI